MSVKKIKYYVDSNGKCQVSEFIEKLETKVKTKILWTLKIISEENRVPDKYFKKLQNTDDI